MKEYYIGVDISEAAIHFGALTESGTLLEKWKIPTPLENNGRYILSAVERNIWDWIPRSSHGTLAGVGLSLPGAVLRSGWTKTWGDLDLGTWYPAKTLSEMLEDCPVAALSHIHAAALGEYWQGGGKGCSSAVFIDLGMDEIQSGMVVNDRLVYGKKGLAGEIGHIVVDPDNTEELCFCGRFGCLNTVASGTGIIRQLNQELAASDAPCMLRGRKGITLTDVFLAARAHDPLAEKAVSYCLSHLAKVVTDIGFTLDPDVFILGGSMAKGGQYMLDFFRYNFVTSGAVSDLTKEFVLARLGDNAAIYGAAKLAIDLR